MWLSLNLLKFVAIQCIIATIANGDQVSLGVLFALGLGLGVKRHTVSDRRPGLF